MMAVEENTEVKDKTEKEPIGRKKLPVVGIYNDPGIWICLDEGCKPNCHGDEWAANTEEKLAKHPDI